MTHFASRFVRRLKRPLVLTGLVLLPLGWGAIDAFAKDHAFLINASPSRLHIYTTGRPRPGACNLLNSKY